MVSTHLKNISQNGNLPQVGVKIKTYLKPPPRSYYDFLSIPTLGSALHPSLVGEKWTIQAFRFLRESCTYKSPILVIHGFSLNERKTTCWRYIHPIFHLHTVVDKNLNVAIRNKSEIMASHRNHPLLQKKLGFFRHRHNEQGSKPLWHYT